MVTIGPRRIWIASGRVVEVIGAGHAGVESTNVAHVPVVTDRPIETVDLAHAVVPGAGGVDVVDQRLCRRAGTCVSRIRENAKHHVLEWSAERWVEIRGGVAGRIHG